jgi:hypothetical protein
MLRIKFVNFDDIYVLCPIPAFRAIEIAIRCIVGSEAILDRCSSQCNDKANRVGGGEEDRCNGSCNRKQSGVRQPSNTCSSDWYADRFLWGGEGAHQRRQVIIRVVKSGSWHNKLQTD